MYVCICNNITSKKIEKAVDNGILDTKHIYSRDHVRSMRSMVKGKHLSDRSVHGETAKHNFFAALWKPQCTLIAPPPVPFLVPRPRPRRN